MRHHESLGDALGGSLAQALDDVGPDAVAEVAEESGLYGLKGGQGEQILRGIVSGLQESTTIVHTIL